MCVGLSTGIPVDSSLFLKVWAKLGFKGWVEPETGVGPIAAVVARIGPLSGIELFVCEKLKPRSTY